MGLLKVSKHVDWGILNHHVLHAHRVLWPPEMHGIAMSKRNVLWTTSSIGAVWMKIEVSFKLFPLRTFAFQQLLVQKNRMLWGVAFLRDMRIASRLVTKLSFVKLMLCHAFHDPYDLDVWCLMMYKITYLFSFVSGDSIRRWILRGLDCTHYFTRCMADRYVHGPCKVVVAIEGEYLKFFFGHRLLTWVNQRLLIYNW